MLHLFRVIKETLHREIHSKLKAGGTKADPEHQLSIDMRGFNMEGIKPSLV